jgi:hypothetical protein
MIKNYINFHIEGEPLTLINYQTALTDSISDPVESIFKKGLCGLSKLKYRVSQFVRNPEEFKFKLSTNPIDEADRVFIFHN